MSEFELHLDCRESHLKREFELMKFKFESKQLDVGDLIITDNARTFIFERKTWSDLYSSIISSRFREQRERLCMIKSSCTFIFYIIEGLKSKLEVKKQKIAQGAIENLVLFHNIPVLYTDSVTDTASKIENWISKIKKQKWDTIATPTDLKTIKKGNNIKSNMFFHQLNLIPGVSPFISEKVSSIYPTVYSLILKYNECNTIKEKELLLSDIELTSRKLGKVLSSRIYNTFTCLTIESNF